MYIILLIVLGLVLTNFSPNVWLSGWDNLHPELGFWINIKRSLFAVWQEYQGLGLLGGMAHAADLPRQILLSILSPILPDNWLRQIYMFSMLLAGSLGMFFLLKNLLLKRFSSSVCYLSATAGAAFYLLNLATIQAFYVPFSPFVTLFASLPWLFYSSFLYVTRPTFSNLLFFTVASILAIPSFYVPTLFIVYAFFLFASLGLLSLQKKGGLFLPSLKVGLFTLVINSFWLLPFTYFVFSSLNTAQESHINLRFTEDNFLKNKDFGSLLDVVLLRGFWFDNADYQPSGVFDLIMKAWRQHFENWYVILLGILLFSTTLLGLVYSFIVKFKYRFVFFFIFLLSFTILANNTPPFSWIDSLFYKWPLFAQVFRFPFTKFSTILSFSYAVFFAFGVALILKKLKELPLPLSVNVLNRRLFIFLLFAGLLLCITFPAFQGKLFYNNLKVNIPTSYFELFGFFKTQDKNSRIANFPQHKFWGWNYYSWGYAGSGFLWYGIEQPILDRAFDVWSKYDENYYWEISYALYSRNRQLFEAVLEKYQVSWLLVDKNIISPESSKALYFDELETLVSSSEKIAYDRSFGNVHLYKVALSSNPDNFVFIERNLPQVGAEYKWTNYDKTYLENGNYIAISDKQYATSGFFYPFRSLFTGRGEDNEFEIQDKGDDFEIAVEIPSETSRYNLAVPESDNLVFADKDDLGKTSNFTASVNKAGNNLVVSWPKVSGYYSYEIDPTERNLAGSNISCNQSRSGKASQETVREADRQFLRLRTTDRTCSASFWLPNLDHDKAYLISVEARNITGKSFVFWIENSTSGRADLEVELNRFYFVQPPMESDGVGYTLHFDNRSIGDTESANDLGKIAVYQMPYKLLTQLKLVSKNYELRTMNYGENAKLTVEHPNPAFYKVEINGQRKGDVLVLSQAYDSGWAAFYEALGRIPGPVVVNNWQNGWVLDDTPYEPTVYIVYLPQLLEYAGFLILGIYFAGLLLFFVHSRIERG